MTRESLNRKMFLHNKKLIDDIFKDIKSRTCENCNLWGSCEIKLGDGSLAYFSKTYGCNEFKKKER